MICCEWKSWVLKRRKEMRKTKARANAEDEERDRDDAGQERHMQCITQRALGVAAGATGA